MRQSPLVRRTGLRRGTGLERGTRLRSTGPIKTKHRDTGPSRPVRKIVRERPGGRCEHCGRADGPMDIHHRRPRAMGGTTDPATNLPSNLVLLDRPCHEWLESHRAEALRAGFLVPQGVDPTTVPVFIAGGWVWLTEDGYYREVPNVPS